MNKAKIAPNYMSEPHLFPPLGPHPFIFLAASLSFISVVWQRLAKACFFPTDGFNGHITSHGYRSEAPL